MAEGLEWLPADGVVVTRADLERIFIDLRALIDGTDHIDPNRATPSTSPSRITQALERDPGGE